MADQPQQRRPANGRTHVASIADVAVDSFYQRRIQRQGGYSETTEFTLWGIQAQSTVPVLDAEAQLDYSLFLPDDPDATVLADAENRMLRLSVQDRHRYMDFGASLFSVGNSFVTQPLARERANAAGINQPGQGGEVWVTGRIPHLPLRPTYRHLERMQDIPGTDSVRESAATTLGLNSPTPFGNLFLRNTRFDDTVKAANTTTGARWEVGANVRAAPGTTLTPVLAREMRFDAAGTALESRSAQLNVHTVLADATAVNLNLRQDRRETLTGEQAILAADLVINAPLRLWPRTPPGLNLSVALGYRGMRGLPVARPDEGMSVRLNFNYQVGG